MIKAGKERKNVPRERGDEPTIEVDTVPAGLNFDFENHIYRWNGEIVPSVTQLLSEFKLIDFSGVPRDRLEFKRSLGVAVHYAIELLEQDNLDEESLSDEIKPYVNAYKRFREVTGFEPRATENRLYSKKWRFAGTLDQQGIHVTKIGGEEAIIDYKCTWKLYASCGPQLQGYKILFEENTGIKIKKLFGLQLKPTGHYEFQEFKDPNDKQDFLACLWLHWQKRNKYQTSKGESNDNSNA